MANILKKLAIGAAIAGAAGYIAGTLSAPADGKKTRKELKKTAEHGMSDAEKQIRHLQHELQSLLSDAKDNSKDANKASQQKFDDLADKAIDSKDKIQDILKAVKGGKANNRDLRKAIDDARNAIDHIKDFIKK